MANLITTQGIEIGIDARQDGRGFAFAEFGYEPFGGGLSTLGVIATTDTMAERDYVCRDGSGASRIEQGNPMIHGYCMPQPRRTPARSTTAIEKSQGFSPIAITESAWKIRRDSTAAMLNDSGHVGIVLTVSPPGLRSFVRVIHDVFERVRLYFAWISTSPLFDLGGNGFAIGNVIRALPGLYFFSISFPVTPISLACLGSILFTISDSLGSNIVAVSLIIAAISAFGALDVFAAVLQTARLALFLELILGTILAMKIFKCGGKKLFAFTATLKGHILRCGIMEGHGNSLSCVKPGTLTRRCPVFLLGFTPVIIPFSGVNANG